MPANRYGKVNLFIMMSLPFPGGLFFARSLLCINYVFTDSDFPQ